MKRALLACLFLLPGCNPAEPTDDGADDIVTADGDTETSESADDAEGDTTTGDGDASTQTTGDGDAETTGDGDAETTADGDTETTGDGDAETTGDGDGDCAAAGDCNDLISAFEAETQAIRSCSDDAQCGQVLQGTSCGCTRNWVARVDADTTCFYDLIDQANVLQCDLGLFSSCDCPEADGYACVEGICTWNYL